MKKLLPILLASTLLLTSCSQNESETTSTPSTSTGSASSSPESTSPSIDTPSPSENNSNVEEQSSTITIVDHDGVEVTLDRDLERVVVASLNPMPSLLSLYLGSGDTIVGMNSTSYDAISKGIMGELYPELLDADTSFYQGNALNIESLLTLDPQLVVITTGSPELRAQIENAGLNAVAFGVSDWGYSIVDTFAQWIDLLGDIYPDSENLDGITQYSNEVVDLVQSRVSGLSEDEIKKIFFLFQYDENTMRTSGNNFFGEYWANTVGGENVATGIDGGTVEVTMEQVYSWEPDIIFVSNFTTAKPDDILNSSIGEDDWSLLTAVQEEQVFKMPLGSFRTYSVSAEMPVVLLWMAQQTYPELFEDIDIVEEMKDFYSNAFQIQLSTEQAETILNMN